METNCLRCNGELVTIETKNNTIKTRFCKDCGLFENSFTQDAIKELAGKAVRVGDDGKIEKWKGGKQWSDNDSDPIKDAEVFKRDGEK